MPSEHAEIPPSTFEHREMCDYWKSDNDGDDNDPAMAKRGTDIHSTVETENFSIIKEEEDVPVAQKCIRYREHVRKGLAGIYTESREVRFTVLSQFGTVDHLFLVPGHRSHIIDWKTGYHGVTDAEFNAQLQGYILGAWDRHLELDEVEGHLFLPRRDEVSTHVYYRERDYLRIRDRVARIIDKSKNPKTYTPVWKACRYCGNIGNCEAYAKLTLELATKYEPDVFLPAELNPENWTTPEQINHGLKLRKVLDRWNEKAYNRASDYLKEGHQLEDFKLIPMSGDRTITDPLQAWEYAQQQGIGIEDFISICKVSAPKLIDFIGKKAPRGQKGKAMDKFGLDLFEAGCLEFGGTEYQIRAKTQKDPKQITDVKDI